jgi:uncharacterized DUF497 family protein
VGFEWDEAKRAANLAKHGVDFVAAVRVFEDERLVEAEDQRREYGELRVRALGLSRGLLLMVVYTDRGDARRIISARRANRHERIAYQRQDEGDR